MPTRFDYFMFQPIKSILKSHSNHFKLLKGTKLKVGTEPLKIYKTQKTNQDICRGVTTSE